MREVRAIDIVKPKPTTFEDMVEWYNNWYQSQLNPLLSASRKIEVR